eukprot:SAG31_NODE_2815_length_5045_cov_3.196522_1_plen_63_part_10
MTPTCLSPLLRQARVQWGFEDNGGYVTSDLIFFVLKSIYSFNHSLWRVKFLDQMKPRCHFHRN